MKIDLRSVGCSLRTACLCIAGYTLLLGFALLGFTIYDYTHAPDYFLWLQISSFNWSFGLWLAAGCLFTGLVRQSRKLVRGWLLLFALYVGFQIAALSWNIYHYFEFTELVGHTIKSRVSLCALSLRYIQSTICSPVLGSPVDLFIHENLHYAVQYSGLRRCKQGIILAGFLFSKRNVDK
ncbi:hypothetical protein RvY_15170-1 [Ramazzottius varieornatus]|uniref:Uncharacterized protein n=1 Tax=Ramazzottius varieornatus TaxID=947166 RepID=A0A1D1W0W8_RAMVA|nr:hypothetical protein RvY_15170-1 [Ramazzottius varieornatus]